MITVAIERSYDSWRNAARSLLRRGVSPAAVNWQARGDWQSDLLASPSDSLFAEVHALDAPPPEPDGKPVVESSRVPREFIRLAASVACHSASNRWHCLYRVLYRLTNGEPSLLDVATDPEVHCLTVMDKAVRRDVHKMHAFVRFKAIENSGDAADAADLDVGAVATRGTRYVAWFEPAHDIVQRATPFFARRFASMRWSILTPRECAHWDGALLSFTPGVERSLAPKADQLEDLWRSYYAHTFNPARVATATMQAEMPQRYWVNLPEASLIAELTREAPARVARMLRQLDQAPAELPDDLRSRVGISARPERTSVREATVFEPDQQSWHAVHDPGTSAAAARSGPAASGTTIALDDIDVRVGTASWTDPTLLRCGRFYPPDVTSPEARLKHFASNFPLVEIDSTFYVPPNRGVAAQWAARTPDHFVFDVKAFSLMTGHVAEVKRMPDWLRRLLPKSLLSADRVNARELSASANDEIWQRFIGALAPLSDAGKLGPILLQFPRWFLPTRESAEFLRVARERLGDTKAAVEFRNPAWVDGRMANRTVSLLEKLKFTYVVVDAPPGTGSSMPPFAAVTTPELSVVRLHGRRTDAWEARHTIVSERYRYLYDSAQLNEWTERIGGIAEMLQRAKAGFPDMAKARQGVHVVFNNCHANYGTSNAAEITRMLIEFDRIRRQRVPVV